MRDEALEEAIASAGGVGRLATMVGVSGPAVSQWKRCPTDRVLQVETATGVSRHRLRPDIYPPSHPPAAAPTTERSAA